MAFTQPCFIRKNTPELRKKLEELGYKDGGKVGYYGESQYLYCGGRIFYESPEIITFQCNRFIDCGDNEELFLALAALRDDTDKNQWFTNTNDYWYKCLDNKFSKETADWVSCASADKWHKATAKEIIEHFK